MPRIPPGQVQYRSDPPAARRVVELDGLTLLFHRRSGQTHILASPAPEILAALDEGAADRDALIDRLARDHDIAGDGVPAEAIDARLVELVEAGLIVRL